MSVITDLVPQTPATVPPLPSAVRRMRSNQSSTSHPKLVTPANLTPLAATAGTRRSDLPLPISGRPRGHSGIADLMPNTAAPARAPPGRTSRLVRPTTVPRRHPLPPPPPPPPRSPSHREEVKLKDEDSSDASLTPTEGEFIEDGLGGSSFLDEARRPMPLPAEKLGTLDPCLAEMLQRRRPLPTNTTTPSAPHFSAVSGPAMDRSLEGYVIVESDGRGPCFLFLLFRACQSLSIKGVTRCEKG